MHALASCLQLYKEADTGAFAFLGISRRRGRIFPVGKIFRVYDWLRYLVER